MPEGRVADNLQARTWQHRSCPRRRRQGCEGVSIGDISTSLRQLSKLHTRTLSKSCLQKLSVPTGQSAFEVHTLAEALAIFLCGFGGFLDGTHVSSARTLVQRGGDVDVDSREPWWASGREEQQTAAGSRFQSGRRAATGAVGETEQVLEGPVVTGERRGRRRDRGRLESLAEAVDKLRPAPQELQGLAL